jgi:hypothetical protein
MKKTTKLGKFQPDQTPSERIEVLVTPPERTLIEEAIYGLMGNWISRRYLTSD